MTTEDMREPSNERLQELIKPIWRKVKPSLRAQSIRSSLSVEFDDPQYASWVSDFMPEYVWDLVDISAQRGIDVALAVMPPPPEREALRKVRAVIQTFDEGNRYYSNNPPGGELNLLRRIRSILDETTP